MKAPAESAGTRALPPGPKGRRLRNLHARATDFPRFLDRLHREYGDIVFFRVPFLPNCVVFEADLAQEVAERRSDFPLWNVWESNPTFDLILAVAEGDNRVGLRRAMLAAVTDERLGPYAEIIIHASRELVERCRSRPVVDVKREFDVFMARCMLDIIVGRAFEIDTDVQFNVLAATKQDMLLSLLPFGPLFRKLPVPYNRRLRAAERECDAIIHQAIGRARDPGHDGIDVISHYVRGREQGTLDLPSDDDKLIRDEALALLTGFFDAPVAGLTCGIHYLAANPDARARLEREVDDILQGRPAAPEDLERLPYARAVFKESLRLSAPGYVLLPRQAVKDCVLGGYSIPRGTVVNLCPRVIHRREDCWDNPGDFSPERWLNGAQPVRGGCPAHAYAPFGWSGSSCPWDRVMELAFVFGYVTIAQHLRLEPESDDPPEYVSVGVGVKGAYRAAVKERRPAPGDASLPA